MSGYVFDRVYLGDGEPGHRHVAGMCDHSPTRAATQSELLQLAECGQCVNRLTDLGVTWGTPASLTACVHHMVGPCDECNDLT